MSETPLTASRFGDLGFVRHEAGRWPATRKSVAFPRALPWAGMSKAFGLITALSKWQIAHEFQIINRRSLT
jgi:hypothetical protein